MKRENANYAIYAICLLWCGVLLGVSFIATPAKFLVVELDIITAIKIGRATFEIYHYFEMVVTCIVFLALFTFRVNKTVWLYFGLLGMVLAIQYFLVEPSLSAESERLFAEIETQSKSQIHLYYIFCDCLKVLLLLAFLPAVRFIDKAPYALNDLNLRSKNNVL